MRKILLFGGLLCIFLTFTVSHSLTAKEISTLNAKAKDLLQTLKNISNKSYSFKQFQTPLNKSQKEIVFNKLGNLLSNFALTLRTDHQYKSHSAASLRIQCIVCKISLSVMKHYSQKGIKDLSKIVYVICRMIPSFDKEICSGTIQIFAPTVVAVLTQSPMTVPEMCGAIMGNKCHSIANTKYNWSVALPPIPKPPVKPVPSPKPGSPTVRVLHISDTHFDPDYAEGSLADCKISLCCRGKKIAASDRAAGKWGDYRNCDIPLRTFENTLQHISSNHKFDYIIWTGDIPPHDIWNTTEEGNIDLLHFSVDLLKKYFPDVPIFPSLGNHESSPTDSYVVPFVKGNWSTEWLYNAASQAWTHWLPDSTKTTVKIAGFYSVEVNPGFRIISLNMNFCNNVNFWLLVNSTDPFDELKWLVDELTAAESKSEKVHIIGHIPPGGKDCMQVWSHNYYKIIDRFESTVAAQFFGHTHVDEFEIFYDVETLKRPTSIAYIGPSVTTYNFVNPGYRIYTVDGNYKDSSWMVLDHDTYYFNLTEANLTDKPIWVHEYSAKSGLNMTSLLPSDWDELLQRFKTDDKLFQKFYRYFHKESDYFKKPCDSKCKTDLLCRLKSGRSADPTLCYNI